jgi:glutathione S-transferase
MSRARLVYFDCRGRADPIRFALELARFPYSFEPVNLATWKTEDKAKFLEFTPFGQLPVYEELNDKGEVVFRLCQSMAILRHIGRKFKLNGTTEQEQARCDEIIDTIAESVYAPWVSMSGMAFSWPLSGSHQNSAP